jgi:hypothetical protein
MENSTNWIIYSGMEYKEDDTSDEEEEEEEGYNEEAYEDENVTFEEAENVRVYQRRLQETLEHMQKVMDGLKFYNYRLPTMADELDMLHFMRVDMVRDKESWDFKYMKCMFTWDKVKQIYSEVDKILLHPDRDYTAILNYCDFMDRPDYAETLKTRQNFNKEDIVEMVEPSEMTETLTLKEPLDETTVIPETESIDEMYLKESELLSDCTEEEIIDTSTNIEMEKIEKNLEFKIEDIEITNIVLIKEIEIKDTNLKVKKELKENESWTKVIPHYNNWEQKV